MHRMTATNWDTRYANGRRAWTTLGQVLHQAGWHPEPVDDRPIYRMSLADRHGILTCYAQIRLEVEQFAFYVIAPVRAPEEMRGAVAEFLTRVNYGLWIGNFEMDWRDGEVRYKSSVDFEGMGLTPQLIWNTINPAVRTMSCYLPGLLSIIERGQSPEQALAYIMRSLSECEGCS